MEKDQELANKINTVFLEIVTECFRSLVEFWRVATE